MRNKDKSTFRKIEFHRKESFYLLVRGLEVGIASGLIAVLYRFLLSFAEKYLMKIIDFVKGNPGKVAVWFVILALIGFLVSMLVKWEVQGGGSGIPQVNGEVKGYINPSWWRVILVKLFGGTASVFSGLSLGREGPSVQLGGMAAKGVARFTKADKTTELRMMDFLKHKHCACQRSVECSRHTCACAAANHTKFSSFINNCRLYFQAFFRSKHGV